MSVCKGEQDRFYPINQDSSFSCSIFLIQKVTSQHDGVYLLQWQLT